ncbi:MAG: low molecular weight protein arginine phosphatase [Peptococcaceae bacterium]|nr:low molecular weight protein arginine phosphatase [Peptococcaceae bacterium]
MKLLFVCTGNTCRSPMAMGLARKYFPPEVEIYSAGIYAWEGQRVSEQAVEALKKKGIDISSHRAKKLTKEMLAEADYILTMTLAQADELRDVYPQYKEKIKTLGAWVGSEKEVPDPIGKPLEVYCSCARTLEQMIKVAAEKLTSGGESYDHSTRS